MGRALPAADGAERPPSAAWAAVRRLDLLLRQQRLSPPLSLRRPPCAPSIDRSACCACCPRCPRCAWCQCCARCPRCACCAVHAVRRRPAAQRRDQHDDHHHHRGRGGRARRQGPAQVLQLYCTGTAYWCTDILVLEHAVCMPTRVGWGVGGWGGGVGWAGVPGPMCGRVGIELGSRGRGLAGCWALAPTCRVAERGRGQEKEVPMRRAAPSRAPAAPSPAPPPASPASSLPALQAGAGAQGADHHHHCGRQGHGAGVCIGPYHAPPPSLLPRAPSLCLIWRCSASRSGAAAGCRLPSACASRAQSR